MPAIVLYIITTALILFVWHRRMSPTSLATAVVLVLLPCCLVGRALVTGAVYAPIDLPFMSEPLKDYAPDYGIVRMHNSTLADLYTQMIPWRHAVRESLLSGHWPLWNRHLLCGTVLAANMQAAPWDPVHLLSLLLPEAQALTFDAAMTFFLACFFTFAFARAIELKEGAALIGAAAYMFSAVVTFFAGWPLARAWTFLPLVLLGVRLVVRERSTRAVATLTAAFVLTTFAGHPESLLHVVFIGALYGLFELAIAARHGGAGALLRPIGLATISGVLALLLSAISLLPFFEAAPQTLEYALRHEVYAQDPFLSQPEQIAGRFALSLFPFFGGRHERGTGTPQWDPVSMSVGSIVLVLALASLVRSRRSETFFFVGLLLFAGCAGLNAYPIAHLLHALPLFNIGLNDRLAFAAVFALSILAAIGADAWETRPRTTAAFLAVVGLVLALAGTAVAASQMAKGLDAHFITSMELADLIPLASLLLLLALRTPSRVALPLVLGLLLLQRGIEAGGVYPTLSSKAFYPSVPILKHMEEDQDTPFRIAGLQYSFIPDAAALYGLDDVRGYEAMTFRRLFDTYGMWSIPPAQPTFNRVPYRNVPFLSLINVKYVIATIAAQPDDQWKLVMEDRNTRLFENRWVLPRAFLPARVRYEKSEDQVIGAMQIASDFRQLAWISTALYPPHQIDNGRGTLKLRATESGSLIDASMESDGWVVITESAWTGWRAYIDGRRVEVHFADHTFLGVFVPAGRHKLELRYLPESFTRGRNISLATFLLLSAFLVVRRSPPRRHEGARAPSPLL